MVVETTGSLPGLTCFSMPDIIYLTYKHHVLSFVMKKKILMYVGV